MLDYILGSLLLATTILMFYFATKREDAVPNPYKPKITPIGLIVKAETLGHCKVKLTTTMGWASISPRGLFKPGTRVVIEEHVPSYGKPFRVLAMPDTGKLYLLNEYWPNEVK